MLYVAIILSNECMDDGNLAWVDPFPYMALQKAISLCTEEGVAMQLWN